MAKRLSNPFRAGSKMHKIFAALARSSKTLSPDDIACRSKVRLSTTMNMLSAMMNPYHRAPMDRAGVRLERTDAGYSLSGCAANPEARRPSRKAKRKSTRKKAKRWTKSKKRKKR